MLSLRRQHIHTVIRHRDDPVAMARQQRWSELCVRATRYTQLRIGRFDGRLEGERLSRDVFDDADRMFPVQAVPKIVEEQQTRDLNGLVDIEFPARALVVRQVRGIGCEVQSDKDSPCRTRQPGRDRPSGGKSGGNSAFFGETMLPTLAPH